MKIERHPGPFVGPDVGLARACAMEVIPWYGNDDGVTHQRIMKDGIWNDHVSVQTALAVIHTLRINGRLKENQRDDKDYAIEFGEYLAVAAKHFLATCNAVEAAQMQSDFGAAERAADAQREAYSGLQEAIYEFRKRAARAGHEPSAIEFAK